MPGAWYTHNKMLASERVSCMRHWFYIQAANIDYRLGGLQATNIPFLVDLEAGKTKTEELADLVSSEGMLPASQRPVFSLCTHMAEGARQCAEVSLMRALIPLLRPHLMTPSLWGLDFDM